MVIERSPNGSFASRKCKNKTKKVSIQPPPVSLSRSKRPCHCLGSAGKTPWCSISERPAIRTTTKTTKNPQKNEEKRAQGRRWTTEYYLRVNSAADQEVRACQRWRGLTTGPTRADFEAFCVYFITSVALPPPPNTLLLFTLISLFIMSDDEGGGRQRKGGYRLEMSKNNRAKCKGSAYLLNVRLLPLLIFAFFAFFSLS